MLILTRYILPVGITAVLLAAMGLMSGSLSVGATDREVAPSAPVLTPSPVQRTTLPEAG
ncbi:MAG: hypothetical protein AAGL89_01550 [Pseudomonadota bacterium]